MRCIAVASRIGTHYYARLNQRMVDAIAVRCCVRYMTVVPRHRRVHLSTCAMLVMAQIIYEHTRVPNVVHVLQNLIRLM